MRWLAQYAVGAKRAQGEGFVVDPRAPAVPWTIHTRLPVTA